MQLFTILLALSAGAAALPLQARDDGLKVLALPITKQQRNMTAINQVLWQTGHVMTSIPAPLINQVYSYVAEFQLGFPAQKMTAMIDTGSSDLWVYTQKSGATPSYRAGFSLFSKVLSSDFRIQYVKGQASGEWIVDMMSLGSAQLFQQQFGAVDSTANTPADMGVFGIGQVSAESASKKYLNFPANLKDKGYIDTIAYSLGLDSIDATEGSILFGGIDTGKFDGPLYTVPFINANNFAVDFMYKDHRSWAILDSGTSLTYLPQDITDAIAADLGAQWVPSQQSYEVKELPQDAEIVYNFSGVKIRIPSRELFLRNAHGTLTLTILPNTLSLGYNLMGDSMLRSAYVVYDLEHFVAGIAQAKYGAPSTIVPISGSIPSSTPAPGFGASIAAVNSTAVN